MRRSLLILALLISLAAPAWAQITQDTHTNLGNNNAATSTLSAAHIMGVVSNGVLVVGIIGDLFAGAADDITSVKWNTSESFTLIGKRTTDSGIGRFSYLYYLLAPTSGTHDVDIVAGSTHYLSAFAVSYSGVGALDTFNTQESGTVADATFTLTVATNAATVLIANDQALGPAAGAGSSLLDTDAFNVGAMFESSPLVQTGSVSMVTHSIGGSPSVHSGVMASFAPAGGGGGGATSCTRALLGVGRCD